jgi:ArsR family transcriptional regulator
MPKSPLEAVLTALADPTRRRALQLLHGADELCVCDLMQALDTSQSRMSRHMATLKEAGLVLDRRDAQWVRYRLNPNMSGAIGAVVKSVMAASRSEKQPRPVRNASRRLRERATA